MGWPALRMGVLRRVYSRRLELVWRIQERAMHNGSCLCGAVTFEVNGSLRPPDACHCNQCRKQSGHFWASTDVPLADLAPGLLHPVTGEPLASVAARQSARDPDRRTRPRDAGGNFRRCTTTA